MLLYFLRRRLGGLEGKSISIVFTKILAASALMGVAAYFAAAWLNGILPGNGWYIRGVRVFTAIGAGVSVLLISARLFGIGELSLAINRVLRRLTRR